MLSSASVVRGCADVTVSRAFFTTLKSNVTHIASLQTTTFHFSLTFVPGGRKIPSLSKIFFLNALLRLLINCGGFCLLCFYFPFLDQFILYLFHYLNLFFAELFLSNPAECGVKPLRQRLYSFLCLRTSGWSAQKRAAVNHINKNSPWELLHYGISHGNCREERVGCFQEIIPYEKSVFFGCREHYKPE